VGERRRAGTETANEGGGNFPLLQENRGGGLGRWGGLLYKAHERRGLEFTSDLVHLRRGERDEVKGKTGIGAIPA